MSHYFEIIGQNNLTVELGVNDISRSVIVRGNQLCANGRVLGEFETHERAEQIFNELVEAHSSGEEYFKVPED